ncbi:MAG TPA: exodeoxyribonuclease V subunit alpha [Candidatus Acidoferrales bacterium]|nr:exodeoxyribonuclease V subunit alpha [Candidatus Acidoferrales bacterium]
MTTLEALLDSDYVSWLDAHFARTMARVGNESRPEVILAAALVSRAVRESHVCLDLRRRALDAELRNPDGLLVAEQPWPQLQPWLSSLRDSTLVSGGDGNTPLVLDTAGRLYLRRYWEHERELAEAIRTRATAVDSEIAAAWLRPTLERLFNDSPTPAGEVDWQRIAAALAALRRFCVISGGPGTGKTFTVVKILALLVELAQQRGERLPRIVLVAPTGKAAARLSESIRNAKMRLRTTQVVKDAIPDSASTIHRCLGSIGGSATRFRHDADNRLDADVVLVDEASMVDVALMARLLAAVPNKARLVLLGDKDQLASVEAGSVLGDICNTGASRSHSQALVSEIAALTGDHLALAVGAPSQTGIWDCIVQLTRSYRYEANSGIGALARAINLGDAEGALTLLNEQGGGTIARIDPASDWSMGSALRSSAVTGFKDYLHEREAAVQLRLLERFRVLCAHRRGASGVETLNRQIEEALRDVGLIAPDDAMYVGRPLMVRRNDYQVRLFNGDVGLVAIDAENRRTRLIVFESEEGQLRWLAPSRLPPHETVFAMSIHKSQGSEFDDVAVVLPSKPSPILTRELLYTAVTRARHHVTIHATEEIIRHTIERRIERASGLIDRLWS